MKYNLKFEKLFGSKEGEVFISREQIQELNKELENTKVSGVIAFLEKRK